MLLLYSFFGRFEQLAIAAIPFPLQLVDWDEPERSGVDAVAQPARFAGTVGEDMSQVAIAVGGTNFGANHTVGCVALLDDVIGFDRFGEAGPAAAALELVKRREEGLA
jgi:hypothetical protein